MGTGVTILISLGSIVVGAGLTWVIQRLGLPRLLRRLRDAVVDREHVSLNEEFLLTQILAERILKGMGRPQIIFAACPGGAMLSEWLSRRFLGNYGSPIPIIAVNLERIGKGTGLIVNQAEVQRELSGNVSGIPKGTKVLLVTDICRGGATLKAAHQYLEEHLGEGRVPVAALFRHIDSAVTPQYVGAITRKALRFDWKESLTGDLPCDGCKTASPSAAGATT